MKVNAHSSSRLADICREVRENEKDHLRLLEEGLAVSCTNLDQFQSWIAAKLSENGVRVETFEVPLSRLENQPAGQVTLREDPGAFRRGPNVVGTIGDGDPTETLLLYAHADKSPESYQLARYRTAFLTSDGRIHGAGIADDVSGITAILSATNIFQAGGTRRTRSLRIASVLGKQMGLLGTYGLVQLYGPVANAIYVHPAESGNGLQEIHLSSNGIAEFRVRILSTPPHTKDPFHAIYDRGAVNSTDVAIYLIQQLRHWAAEVSDRYRHLPLERETGKTFSVLISSLQTTDNTEVYQVPIACSFSGVICFPPGCKLSAIKKDFEDTLLAGSKSYPGLSSNHVVMRWGDHMAQACASDENSRLVRLVRESVTQITGRTPKLTYAYSLSDIRYPIELWNSQTVGIGPRCGEVGEINEWIDRTEYLDTIAVLAFLAESRFEVQ